jgi:flagellar secretion chaperone FliS
LNTGHQAQVNAYKKNHFYTVDRGSILLMLYQGAIDFVKRAKEHLEKGEMAEKGTCISKAHAIITEFQQRGGWRCRTEP